MNILIVAAHPDDEVLGCGGAMARHAADRDQLTVMFLADGETARGSDKSSEIGGRRDSARAACAILGATDVRFFDFPDNQMDTVPLLEVCKSIESVIEDCQPSLVYTHHGGDVNIDHRLAYQATLTACRPTPGTCVREVRTFEVLSSTEWSTSGFGENFRPNLFIDIDEHLSTKQRALEVYASEMRAFPHARSYEAVDALARYRGISAGLRAAEAFQIERRILP